MREELSANYVFQPKNSWLNTALAAREVIHAPKL